MDNLEGFQNKTVAILVANGFDEKSMSGIQKALIAAGATTRLVSTETGIVNGWTGEGWGHNYFVEEKVNDVLPSGFDGLLVPGGERSVASLARNAHVKRIVKGMMDRGRMIVALDEGARLLVACEVAAGRTVSCSEALKGDLEQAGVACVDAAVFVDENLITAYGDTAREELLESLHAALSGEGKSAAAA